MTGSALEKFNLFDYIEQTNRANSVDDAFLLLETALKSIGIDRVVYSLMTDHPSVNKKAGHAILGNYPEDWMKYYCEKTYEDVDPVRKHIMVSSRPFLWQELGKTRGYSKDEEILMHEANDAKLLDGIGLSIHGVNGEVVGMGFASSCGGVELNKDTMSLVNLLSYQFHNVFQEIEKAINFAPPEKQLTPREKEVLLWVARGKSYSVIGDILKISDNTVDYHMRNIFSKLDTNHHVLAVVKAIRLGLILP